MFVRGRKSIISIITQERLNCMITQFSLLLGTELLRVKYFLRSESTAEKRSRGCALQVMQQNSLRNNPNVL